MFNVNVWWLVFKRGMSHSKIGHTFRIKYGLERKLYCGGVRAHHMTIIATIGQQNAITKGVSDRWTKDL